MKKLLLATVFALSFAQSNATIVLHTTLTTTADDKTEEQITDISLNDENQGTLIVPNNIKIEFTAIPQADTDEVTIALTIKKDEEIVAQSKVAAQWGKQTTLNCTACPCTREDIDYTLKITPESNS